MTEPLNRRRADALISTPLDWVRVRLYRLDGRDWRPAGTMSLTVAIWQEIKPALELADFTITEQEYKQSAVDPDLQARIDARRVQRDAVATPKGSLVSPLYDQIRKLNRSR